MLAGHAQACSRKDSCERSDRVVAEGTCSRGNATRHAPPADRSMMDIERRDWCCASIACRRGSLTRGQATVLQGGAALISPSVPLLPGTLVQPRIDARSVDAERCRTD